MEDLTRRRALSIGAVLGLTAVTSAPQAWSWSSAGSIAGVDAVTDPFQVWDPVADDVAARLLADGSIASVNRAWKAWNRNSDALPSGMPGYLTDYLRDVNRLPSWADPALLAASEKLYKRLNSYLFVSESLGSGILSTVIPREARAVYWSAGGADMKERAAKTFTFGYDLHSPTTWQPQGYFVVSANKTRLVHSVVRNLLVTSKRFMETADQPKPISNGDILVTFHSVATVAYKNMKKWGIKVSAQEEAADLHAWQVALHLLGVQRQFIPASWAEAVKQADQMLWPVVAPTAEGINLARTLIGYIEDATLGLTTGFVNEMVRYLIGDKYADWLGLPRDWVSRGLIKVAWPVYVRFREGLSPVAPEALYLFDQFIRGVAMMFLNNGTSPTQTLITLPAANRPGA
ncbi:oxygenase MpaB family protein [Streptomyces sp. NPDC087440]|uniref:oxygenase MpaB family protein n=1 Tax=Streptomyces sp. NPDC087440 TaxID=3365790 RepID=UPI00381B7779